jgi:LCP family protein required for cell wall assembly
LYIELLYANIHIGEEGGLMKNKDNNRKKLGILARIAIISGSIVLIAAAGIFLLGYGLLGRITRPETPAVFEDDEPEETETPAAETPVPGSSEVPVTPTPIPTPEPILPLAELYPQTKLTAEQYAAIEAHNNDSRNYYHVLLLGVDRRGKSGNSRADTMMLATIDKKNGRLKLTSILRDLLVEIPGHGEGKLNSAAAFGGVDLLMETISYNLHIEVDRYVLVDFRMFEQVIDKMGGVTVKMSAAEISAANDCIAGLNKQWGVPYLWDGFIFANAGNVKLTGKQALGFARVRHMDNDFKRTNRQFEILEAAFAKFLKKNVTSQYSMLYDLLPLVETNLTNGEITELALNALSVKANGLLHYTVPADGMYKSATYNRSSVLLSDLSANAWAAHTFIFESSEVPDDAKVLSPGASLPPRTPSPSMTPTPSPGNWPPFETPDLFPTPEQTPEASPTPVPTEPQPTPDPGETETPVPIFD